MMEGLFSDGGGGFLELIMAAAMEQPQDALLELDFIPEAVTGFVIAIAIVLVGYVAIMRLGSAINQLVSALDLSDDASKAFADFFVIAALIYVIGVGLAFIPPITDPTLIPTAQIGLVLTSVVELVFKMLVPIAIVFAVVYWLGGSPESNGSRRNDANSGNSQRSRR